MYTLNEHREFRGTAIHLQRRFARCQSLLTTGTSNIRIENGRVRMIGHDLFGRGRGVTTNVAQLLTHHLAVVFGPVITADWDPLLAVVDLKKACISFYLQVILGLEPQSNHII